ncbi:MAG: hypothetical protein SRB1_01216 [Desulfobacteraceae bacterium Eth-SRB1]|nr:MAG: hypothetical protein SRB1_01216 [Desulfobacteraceae bacterium Eth-SRB1]
MDKEKRLERVKELIKELGVSSLDGAVVVVEGRRDDTLRKRSVTGKIVFATRRFRFLRETLANE